MRTLRGLVIALVLLAPASALAAVEGPVAVLPFNNLNKNPDFDWLTNGISETLISDIKRSSGMTVVERDQLERALSEIAFQQEKETDVNTAAAVGRIVGAKTVVVGGYQKSGNQLRITARFVAVETGVILDAAKATGTVQNIFALQDEITAKLLGKPVRRKPRKLHATGQTKAIKRPSSGDKSVKAYRLYAMSMETATDAQRVSLLRQALEVDPDFYYAEDEMDALLHRLDKYREAADVAASAKEKAWLATLRKDGIEETERRTAYLNLRGSWSGRNKVHAMLDLDQEMYSQKWQGVNAQLPESILMNIFMDYMALKEHDKALQVGEQFLKEYGASPYYSAIDSQMRMVIDARKRAGEARTRAEEQLGRLDVQRARVELKRCTVADDEEVYDRAIELCTAYLEKYEKSDLEGIRDDIHRARWIRAQAYYETGAFAKARHEAQALLHDAPEFAEKRSVAKVMRRWPRELP